MRRLWRTLLAAALVACLAFSFASCGTTEGGNTSSATDTREELRVGLECAYAPFNWTQIDNSNNAVQIEGSNQFANGYDVQIAQKIANDLNRKLVIVKLDWDGLIPAVQSGAIDMIIAGMSPTAERKESIDFSDAYYTSNLVVVVRKDGAYANASSLKDLSGAKVVGQLGTFHETAVSQIPGVLKQTSMADFPTMIVALKSKSIDGYIAEKPGAIANCAANSELTYVNLENNASGFTVSDEDVQIAVGIKKGSTLTAQVNAALAKITTAERDTIMNNAISQQP